MRISRNSQLQDIGERRLVSEILWGRYGREIPRDFGQDCAFLHARVGKGEVLVVTTDPCPTPMAWMLGFKDYFYYGWLFGTINLSDIAASGARPIGFLSSLLLPNSLRVGEFLRLLDGLDSSLSHVHTRVLGGNLRESRDVSAHGTAFGVVRENHLLRRDTARPGDNLVVVGDLGDFWAACIALRDRIRISRQEKEYLLKNVLTPRARNREAILISKHKLLTSCIDNSDGLYPSIKQLAEASHLRFVDDFSKVPFHPAVLRVAKETGLDPVRFCLGWGDWQLIGTVRPEKTSELMKILSRIRSPCSIIGFTEKGPPDVILRHEGKGGNMLPLDSERLTRDSWFSAGIDAYIHILKEHPLVTK